MGNHEYCEECGASDFHYNKPCNPERKAKFQAEQDKLYAREQQAEKAAKKAVKKLQKLGYKAKTDQYGNIVIDKWSFLE
jgi:hypothetical protein